MGIALLPLAVVQGKYGSSSWIRSVGLRSRIEETLGQLLVPSRPSIWAGAGVPEGATPPYIYVRRRGRRRITNEDEVSAFMESRGIVPIDMEGMPIVNQIQLFKQARLIVGSHGAGLTNLIFSDRTEVVELFGPWKSLCFAAIARGFGHGYAGVDLLPSAGFQDGDIGRASDFGVDLRRVRPIVDQAIERARS